MQFIYSPMLAFLVVGTAASVAQALQLNAQDCTFNMTANSGDDCDSIASQWGLSIEQFIQYNPQVGADCSKLVPGQLYCVEQNEAQPPKTTSTRTSTTATATAPAPPTNTQDGVTKDCTAWHLVVKGDTCQKIVNKYKNITIKQFYQWNPDVGDDCMSLFLDYYVCVGVSGTGTGTGTTSGTTTTTKTATDSPLPEPIADDVTPLCTTYYKVVKGDTCAKIVNKYKTFTLKDFYSWNPSVGDDCATLMLDYYYCVGVSGKSGTTGAVSTTSPGPTRTSSSTATKTTAGDIPSPTQDGADPDCNKWYLVAKGDNCSKIASKYKIKLDDFYKWNPDVGTDCSTLFLDYYVCVGVQKKQK